MISNTLKLFYLTTLKDYKKYWLKTVLSLIGLILSISLVTAVSIYTDTINGQLSKQPLLYQLYPKHYLTHQKGFLNSNDIQTILNHPAISHGYPYKSLTQSIDINNQFQSATIIGIDLIYLSSYISNSNTQPNNTSIFLITNLTTIPTNSELTITINNQQQTVLHLYEAAQSSPLIVMDISTMINLFDDPTIDQFHIQLFQATQYLTHPNPNYQCFTTTTNKQQLSQAFFINLQFIGIFSIIISTLLVFLFFRFIQKQRNVTNTLLHNLGINYKTQQRQQLIESLFFIILTTSLGFLLGISLSHAGLSVLSTTLNTLYYKITIDHLIIHPLTFVKSILIASIAVIVAINPKLQQLEITLSQASGKLKWTIFTIMVSIGLALIFLGPSNYLIAYKSMAGLIILTFFISLSSISLFCYITKFITFKQLLMTKTAAYYLKKEIIVSTVMVMAIALACGLFISMSIFITSFQSAVSQWITKSTQSDVYIQAKNNSIPTPVAIDQADIEKLITHPATISWRSISRDNVVINNKPLILRGLSYKNLEQELDFITTLPNSDMSTILSKNSILISESAAKKLNLSVGQTLTIPTPTQPFTGIISGIHVDYASEHGVITLSETLMQQLYQDQFKIHGISLMIDSQYQTDLFNQFSHLLIQTKSQLQQYVITMFKQTFGLTWVLASISGIIALFVLINMLSVMSINRRYEMIQLFSIGGQQKHLKQLIFSHAFTLGSISLIISLLVGFGLALIILYQLTPSYFGWNIPIQLYITPIISLMIAMIIVIALTAYLTYRHVWSKITSNDYIFESIKTLYFQQ